MGRASKNLSASDLKELEEWLSTFDITINYRVRRKFSDVTPTAIIVKKLQTKLVDLFNYPARNSYVLKLSNWETFNRKVLKKINLNQSKQALANLASGESGAIETLLYRIMLWDRLNANAGAVRITTAKNQIDEQQTQERSNIVNAQIHDNRAGTITTENGTTKYSVDKSLGFDVITIEMKATNQGQLVTKLYKMINLQHFEELQRQIADKDKYIAGIQQQNNNLLNGLQIKDQRIGQLVDQLKQLTNYILSRHSSLEEENSKSDITEQ